MAKRGDVKQTYTVVTGGSHRVLQVRAVQANGWTKAKRATFLAALAMTCNVTSSAAAAGMKRRGASALKQRDPLFAAQWAAALASGYERLEEGLLAVAIAGLNAATALNERTGAVESDDAAEDGIDPGCEPATGVVPLASMQAVQVALALLARRSADAWGGPAGGGRARRPHRRATQAETDAAIAKKLDSLARRVRASKEGGGA